MVSYVPAPFLGAIAVPPVKRWKLFSLPPWIWAGLLTNKMFFEFWSLVLKRPCTSCLCSFKTLKPPCYEGSSLLEDECPHGGEVRHLADSRHKMPDMWVRSCCPPQFPWAMQWLSHMSDARWDQQKNCPDCHPIESRERIDLVILSHCVSGMVHCTVVHNIWCIFWSSDMYF